MGLGLKVVLWEAAEWSGMPTGEPGLRSTVTQATGGVPPATDPLTGTGAVNRNGKATGVTWIYDNTNALSFESPIFNGFAKNKDVQKLFPVGANVMASYVILDFFAFLVDPTQNNLVLAYVNWLDYCSIALDRRIRLTQN